MALYKDKDNVNYSGHEAFDKIYKPGDAPPYSGIYRCINCGDEIAANKNNPLPPQNDHQHRNSDPIRWKLHVYAEQKK